MDVTDLLRRLLRRSLAVAAVVVVAVLAAAVAWTSAGSSQQSTATVVIVPPTLGGTVSDLNPLLNLENQLSQLATVLASSMGSETVADQLDAAGATGEFTISTVTGTNPSFAQLSPQLVFTATAPTAATAERTAAALVTAATAQLTQLQTEAAVPDEARVRLLTVVPPTPAQAAGSGRLRAAGGVGLGVVVLGVVGVLLVDDLLSRRGRRRTEPEPESTRRRRGTGRA